MKIHACLLLSPLVATVTAQTWSPFALPPTPFETLAGSSVGLIAVGSNFPGPLMVSEHDGTNWTQRNPTSSPSPRFNFALAYDSVRQRVILFGGNGGPGIQFADTWEWTGTTWQPMFSVSYPSARSHARMAFDSTRARTVLFGGIGSNFSTAETWEYSSPNWSMVPSTLQPSPRVEHGLAFDPTRHRTILFGGVGSGQLSDTWEWDGTNWTVKLPALSPAPRSQLGMCFDPYSGGVLVFGGRSSNFTPTYYNDAFVWNGTTWVPRIYFTTPLARANHAMAHDEVHQSIAVLGGNNGGPLADAWVFPGTGSAVAQPFGTGCGSLSLVCSSAAVLGQTFQARVVRASGPVSIAFMGVGFSNASVGPFSLPLSLDGYGMLGCWLYHDMSVTAFDPCPLGAPGQATYTLPIPAVLALSGMQFYLQGWVPDSGAPGGIVTTNGMRVVLGF